ncbi:hypothetical protein BC835DRAFT_1305793 [Cytidiella melzeri]|nr:hypothetical protein BC835DRAFT_1305793 [Cytidiella melzeri]
MPANKSKSSAHPLCNKPKASNAAPAAKKRRSKSSLSAPAPKRPCPVVPQSPDSSDNNAGGQNSNIKSKSKNDVPVKDLAPKERVMAIHAALITVRAYVTTSNDPVLKQLVSKGRWLPRMARMVLDNMDDIFSFGAKVGGAIIEEGSHIWKELKAGSATSEGRVVWDNIAGLKGSIHSHIISEEPIPAGTPKNQLGWGNITTARLLVPQHMRVAFDRNPTSLALIAMSWSFCNAVTSGKKDIMKDILAKNLPSFLWDNNKESDCKMFDKGLLRGIIAWAAVMARFSLSSDMWDTIIHLFDSDLELGNPEWACNTLRWWNRDEFDVPAAVQADCHVKNQAVTTEVATKEAKRRNAQAHDEAISQAEDGFEPEATPPQYNSMSQGGKEDSEDAFRLLQVYGDIGNQADFESDSVSAGSRSDSEHSDNLGDKKEYGDGWP